MCAATLFDLLDQDSTIIAAWRDLVAACQDPDHIEFSYDRVAFLRDNVIALQEHRRQDPGHWGLITTAVKVLFDDRFSVHLAQAHLGDPPIEFHPRSQEEPTGLTDAQRMDLTERWIVRRPSTKDVVVWFRIANAFISPTGCMAHGDITFYSAQVLAGAIIDHEVARETYEVVPEELLIDEISAQQASPHGIDEYHGIEHRPGMVYARVVVRDVEPHRAVDEARMLLDSLLAVIDPHEDMWKILKGHLTFDDTRHYRPLEWGPKTEPAPPIYYQNDHVGRDLRALNDNGHEITRETARALQPIIQLSNALKSVSAADPEGAVMAAVRAIEHCNSWTTRGRKTWNEFINSYLLDQFTRISFLKRASEHTFDAIVRTVPDRSPNARPVPELDQIKDDVSEGSWGQHFHVEIAMKHIAALKRIYTDHPLARPLSELGDILQSGTSIGDAIDVERHRVSARVARLTRSRNAAIHGGPLSKAACESISDFGIDLANQALTIATRAILHGESIPAHMAANRDDNQRRIQALRRTGDQRHFMVNSPAPKQPRSDGNDGT